MGVTKSTRITINTWRTFEVWWNSNICGENILF